MNIEYIPKESQIQTAIMNYLSYRGYYVMRLNSGAIQTVNGMRVRLSEAGTPDILAIKQGRIVFIEVKRPGNKPTERQIAKMKTLEEYGARCIVAHSVDELEIMLAGLESLSKRYDA